ncbi:lantibiotic dehydratase [Enhygromyxa salina]|uniref:Lantibiotic dehydratase N-terminal domain-containing protein n=1 Tax=Enhygromyxa salina TaxID=215803 RepID=A0A2S9YT88_9BACT|nr:lantibiotic dehydratase [Enhygromyxa salina]PRQ08306.1 hypothetical protein ENSA7_19290 [Enhygromyxa salina]
MSRRWEPRPLLGVRIAGLPLSILDGLELCESAATLGELDVLTDAIAPQRDTAIELLHALVGECDDEHLRRRALTLKRRLFNAKPLRRADLDHAWPPDLRERLASIHAQEAQRRAVERRLVDTVERERRDISKRLCARLDHPRLLGGVLLSSRDHFDVARQLHELADSDHHPASRVIREATIARYLLRATLRTTPFSSFAGVAVFRSDIDSEAPESPSPTWVGIPQLNAALLGERLFPTLDPQARAGLSLRVTPLRTMVAEPRPHLLFARQLAGIGADGAPSTEWGRLELSLQIAQLMDAVEGTTAAQAIAALASAQLSAEVWSEALDALVAAGVIERLYPAVRPTASGLASMAAELEALGDRTCSARLRAVSTDLERYAKASITERAELQEQVAEAVGVTQLRGCLFEDYSVHGLRASDLPLSVEELTNELRPAAALASASATNIQHRSVAQAFCERFGADGQCDDVPGFIAMVMADGALLEGLRRVDAPIPWQHHVELTRALESTAKEPIELDAALLEGLPGAQQPCSIMAFVQLATRDGATDGAVERIVLNGVQSGRDKYLSRYLADPQFERDLLPTARAWFDAAEPVPVAVHVGMGLNFQLHPRLTRYALDVPLEVCRPPGGDLLSLGELELSFDSSRQQLRLHAPRLGKDIEPVHLGFVRDQLLPDPLLVIRALSPRIGEETIAERAAIYATLDATDLLGGVSLRRFRPRLQVGRLVLERARWAIPVSEIPSKEPREPYSQYFVRLERWRRSEGIPQRGFGRRLSRGNYPLDISRSQQYLDWRNPLVLSNLRRLLGELRDDSWLSITELLPTPAQSHIDIDGQRHCAELLVQLDWNGS